MIAWEEDRHLRDLLSDDPEVSLTEEDLDACFSLDPVHESAHVVFERLKALAI